MAHGKSLSQTFVQTQSVRLGAEKLHTAVALLLWVFALICLSLAQTASAQELELAPSAEEEEPEEEVVIHASRPLLRSAADAPTVASTVIEGEDLRRPGSTSAEVLMRVPGVQVSRSGTSSDLSTASIRGSDSSQVPIYVAGIRINDDVSGTADLSTVPLWMMERVEVFRGNAPERADQLGLGGAIFFTPRYPQENRVGVGAELGSFGHVGGWLSGEVAGESASALVAYRHAQAKNDYKFINDEGQRFDIVEHEDVRQNADSSENEAWAIGRYTLGRGARITSVIQAFEREQGVSGLSVTPARAARARTRRQLMGLSSRLPCSPMSDSCTLELSSSFLTSKVTHSNPFYELGALGTKLFENRGERFTQTGRLKGYLTPELRSTASLVYNSENLRVDRLDAVPRRGKRSSLRLAGEADYEASEDLLIHGLVAGECHHTSGQTTRYGSPIVQESGTCGVLAPTGRVGLKWSAIPGTAILGNAGRYVRVPTLTELYGASALVQGNPLLVPETGWSLDLGTRYAWSASGDMPLSLALDSFAYIRWADELIRYRRTSFKAVGPFNVESGRFIGFELAGALEAFRLIRAHTALAALDPRETTSDELDSTTNDILPLSSRLVLTQEVEFFQDEGWKALSQDRVGLLFRYTYRSARYQDSAGQVVLPEQHFVDVEASSFFAGDKFAARFAVKNVFDFRTSDLLGMPLPGRSYNLSLEAWF